MFFKPAPPFRAEELDPLLERVGGGKWGARCSLAHPVCTWVEITAEQVVFRAACEGGDRCYGLPPEELRPLLEELSSRGYVGRLSAHTPQWDAEAVSELGDVLQYVPAGTTVQFGGDRYDAATAPAVVDQLVRAGVRCVAFDNIDLHPQFDHLPSDHDPREAEAFLAAVVEALPDAPAIQAVSVRYIPVDERAWSSLEACLRRVPSLRSFRLRSVDIAAERSAALLASLSDTGLEDLRYCGPLGRPGDPRCVRLPAGLAHLALELDEEPDARVGDLLGQIRALPLRRLRLDDLPAGRLGEVAAHVRRSRITDLRVTLVGDDFDVRTVFRDLVDSPVRKLRVNASCMYHAPHWLQWADNPNILRPVADALICAGVDAWGPDSYRRDETQASLRLAYDLYAGSSAVLPAELLVPALELAFEFPRSRLERIAALQ